MVSLMDSMRAKMYSVRILQNYSTERINAGIGKPKETMKNDKRRRDDENWKEKRVETIHRDSVGPKGKGEDGTRLIRVSDGDYAHSQWYTILQWDHWSAGFL